MIKTWWINNNWRFWSIKWALADELYIGVEAWQEYRYMLNPDDERNLVELILEEYDRDVERVLCNPIVRILIWVRQRVVMLRGDSCES